MRPKRRGIPLTVVGAVMLIIIAPACAVIGIVVGVNNTMDAIQDAPIVQTGSTYQATAGHTVTVLGFTGMHSGSGVSTGTHAGYGPGCQVTSPSGEQVNLTPSSSLTITSDSRRFSASGEFTPQETGEYAISCGGGQAMVLDSSQADDLLKNTFIYAAVGVGTAVVVGIIAIILIVVGIVKINRSGNEMRDYDARQAGWAPGTPQW